MWCFTRLLLFFVGFCAVSSQQIQLVNNGYENILIAISDTIPYDPDLIPRIKTLFNDASATLFEATAYRAYFRNITILVPSKWNVSEAKAATMESFDKANIRVDQPSSQYGDNPWVRQTGGCGVPGDFMHLSAKFILDVANSVRKWGSLEKTIVHEWGHLRWGLFDEYPVGNAITEHFYQSPSTGKIEASRCNTKVQGRMRHRVTGAPCNLDPSTSLPEKDCRYYPNKAQSTAISSLMYYHFLPSVNSFCDDDDLGYYSVHNAESSSQHNRLCAGQSSWKVMKQSPDFFRGKNAAIDSASKDTSVSFNVVQRRESRVVVVMDTSTSMGDNKQYIKMNAAVRRYLLYTVPDGASVGLVKYSGSAYDLTTGLRKISNVADRVALANLVPLEYSGTTAIGRGLVRAQRMLKLNRADTSGSRIILLTDGQENQTPNIAEVLPAIQGDGIIIDTILLTSAASDALISAAASTGGLSFFASGDTLSTSLNDAFTTSERARAGDPRDVPITIESRVISVSAKNTTCYDVMIDETLGRDTTFTFSWIEANRLRIALTNGNDKITTALEDSRTTAAGKCQGECATGLWSVCITNNANRGENVISQVESAVKKVGIAPTESSNSESLMPILVRTMIVNKEPEFNKKDEDPVSLFATVTRGYSPVIGVAVVATIEYPNSGRKTKLEMRDNGAGADITKEDGIYSAYILNSNQRGKHTISVEVASETETKIKMFKASSSAGSISEPGDDITTADVELIPVDTFQRFSLAGFIDVQSATPPNRDMRSPGRIIDLEVTEAKYEESRITLEWTAVGDDLDKGTASSYDLLRAANHKVLYGEKNATIVNNATEVVSGNLSFPRPAYTREQLTITIPDRDQIYVYAIIAKDEAGNSGPISNIVSAKLVYVEPPEKPEHHLNTSTIIGVSVGAAVFVIVVIVVISVLVVRSVKKGKPGGVSGTTHSNKAYVA